MAESTVDPYAILGLEPDASAEQVAQAHRRLAKRYHPDVNPGAEATERMRRINEARQTLASPARRARFERTRSRRPAPGSRGTAAWRGEWPPRSSASSWPGAGGHSYWQPQSSPTWSSPGQKVLRSRPARRMEAADDLLGSFGCGLLLFAALLFYLLVRLAL